MPPKTRSQQRKSRKRKLNVTADAVLSEKSISNCEEKSQQKQKLSHENGTLPSLVSTLC